MDVDQIIDRHRRLDRDKLAAGSLTYAPRENAQQNWDSLCHFMDCSHRCNSSAVEIISEEIQSSPINLAFIFHHG